MLPQQKKYVHRQVQSPHHVLENVWGFVLSPKKEGALTKLSFHFLTASFFRRQKQKLVHVLEVTSDTNRDVHMVKEHVRAGAGHLMPDLSDLRPPICLVKTLHYLVGM